MHTAGGSSQHDSHLAMPLEPSRVFTPPLFENEDLSIQKLLLQPAVQWCSFSLLFAFKACQLSSRQG